MYNSIKEALDPNRPDNQIRDMVLELYRRFGRVMVERLLEEPEEADFLLRKMLPAEFSEVGETEPRLPLHFVADLAGPAAALYSMGNSTERSLEAGLFLSNLYEQRNFDDPNQAFFVRAIGGREYVDRLFACAEQELPDPPLYLRALLSLAILLIADSPVWREIESAIKRTLAEGFDLDDIETDDLEVLDVIAVAADSMRNRA